MTAGPALPCPSCRRTLEPISWHDEQRGSCWGCKTDFEFVQFPALSAKRPKVVPQAVLVAEHATCFFHAENQAETVCEGCGRLVCAVCAVDFGGRRVCPPCIAATNSDDVGAMSQRVLFDGIALGLAVIPLLFWPVTAVTGPLALVMVIYGWRKPRSVVGSGRSRMVLAGVIALAQVVGWGFLLAAIWTRG